MGRSIPAHDDYYVELVTDLILGSCVAAPQAVPERTGFGGPEDFGVSGVRAYPSGVAPAEREVGAASSFVHASRLQRIYLGYKFIDLKTAQVVTTRRQNVRLHEEFTTDGTYMKHLLENAFMDGAHALPDTVPVARIRTSLETYLPGWDTTAAVQEKRVQIVSIAGEPQENMLRSSDRPESLDGSGLMLRMVQHCRPHSKFRRLRSHLRLPKFVSDGSAKRARNCGGEGDDRL